MFLSQKFTHGIVNPSEHSNAFRFPMNVYFVAGKNIFKLKTKLKTYILFQYIFVRVFVDTNLNVD